MPTKNVPFILSADVAASSGTFTVSYPAGYTDGHFEQATGAYIMLNGQKLKQPVDIGLSYGDTSVTVTNRTSGILPAFSQGYFQFKTQERSLNTFSNPNMGPTVQQSVQAGMNRSVYINLGSPLTAASNNVSASQSVTIASTPLALLNGAIADADGSKVTLDVPRNVVAAWTGTAILTVTGKDQYGQTVVEKSASGTSLTGAKAFKVINSCSFSANVTSATIGTGDVLGLPVRILNSNQIINELQAAVSRPRRPGYMRLPYAILEAEADAGTLAYIYPGVAGTVVDHGLAIGDTVTTGGTMLVKVGTTTAVGATITIADGVTAGQVYLSTATVGDASLAVLSTDYISITPASAINASGRMVGWVGIQTTNLLEGTLVTGLAANTASTATTADVRGTYDPATACDGTTNFGLMVLVPQDDDLGNPQFAG